MTKNLPEVQESDNQDIKFNWLTAGSIIAVIVGIPLMILSDILVWRSIGFIVETIVMTIFPLLFIYFLGMAAKNEKALKNIIRVVLLILFLIYMGPTLVNKYADFSSVITQNYQYSEGEATIVDVGSRGYVEFSLNNAFYSVSTHNYDYILRRDYHVNIRLKITYLPHSKYIINME